MVLKTTNTDFKILVKDYDLRVDSKFFIFVNKNDFKLIKINSKEFVKMKNLLVGEYTPFNYENGKKYKGLETAKGYLDEEGNVIDYFEATKENHPDRLKFLAKEGQIVISSLKGAKIQSFIVSKNIDGYVLSNGFYIFRVSNKSFNRKFIYYILKSKELRKILDDYLSRGIGISSYKERELLRIKIPLVSVDKQEKVVEELDKLEIDIAQLKSLIPDTQKVIENVFETVLKYVRSKDYIKTESKFFKINLKDIGLRKNLRCGARYYLFWKIYQGVIFKAKNNFPVVKMKELMKLSDTKLIHKGYLDKSYILLDKEDVEPKTGVIKEESYIDKIDSDKILFGNADILISKLRPYLGHVIINDKTKPYIGTTEFLPFIVDKEKIYLEFLKYVLLSDAFLKLSTYIMSGKEHPRVTPYELLALKIPLPPLDMQEKTLMMIEDYLGNIKGKKHTLIQFRNRMNEILIESLK